MKAFEVSGLDFGYAAEDLFHGFNLVVEAGEFFGIIGPNGAGKSTLLRLLAGFLKPRKGRVLMLGEDIVQLPRRDIARAIGVVLQETFFTFDYTVEEVVMMGRNPHLGRFEQPRQVDRARVIEALDFVDAADLADKRINEVSSGEKQRVVLARALAQEPEMLLLDEATSHLDISHQQSIARILVRLNQQGRTIVMLSHDLNLASLYCSRVLLLNKGKQVVCDVPDRVITKEFIQSVYGVAPILTTHPVTGRPQILLPA